MRWGASSTTRSASAAGEAAARRRHGKWNEVADGTASGRPQAATLVMAWHRVTSMGVPVGLQLALAGWLRLVACALGRQHGGRARSLQGAHSSLAHTPRACTSWPLPSPAARSYSCKHASAMLRSLYSCNARRVQGGRGRGGAVGCCVAGVKRAAHARARARVCCL